MNMMKNISENLKRRRLILGLDQSQMAERAGISRVSYCQIETGKSEPREETLSKLCSVLGVSSFDLIKPSVAPKALNFRIRKTLTAHERACSEQTVADSYKWLHDYCFLADLDEQSDPDLLSKFEKRADESIKMFAIRMRAALLDGGRTVEMMCSILEEKGIKLYFKPFTTSKCFGFSYGKEDGGPAIAVNTSSDISVERQLFTLLHELGHLFLHRNAYRSGFQDENKDQEKEADEFAAHFLMPEDLFRRAWSETFDLPWFERIIAVKRLFKVSYLTVIRRLSESNGNLSGYSHKLMMFRSAYQKRYGRKLLSWMEPCPVDFIFKSQGFALLARNAYEEGEISQSRLAEILDMRLIDVRTWVAKWGDDDE